MMTVPQSLLLKMVKLQRMMKQKRKRLKLPAVLMMTVLQSLVLKVMELQAMMKQKRKRLKLPAVLQR